MNLIEADAKQILENNGLAVPAGRRLFQPGEVPTDLSGQLAVSLVIPRDHHQPRGIPVEAVHDARALHATDRRPAPTTAEQAVNQRPGRMAGPRMHDEPRRLVDDDQVLVLVEHVKIHWFGFEPGRRRGRHFPAEAIAGAKPARRARRSIVEANVAVDDEPVHLAAAMSGEQPGQVLIQSRGVDRDRVLGCLAQARRGRPLRQTVPIRSTATPTVIDESATLKIGQWGTWIKSMTEPWTPRS